MNKKFKKVKWLNCDADCTVDGVMRNAVEFALHGWNGVERRPMFQTDGKYYAIVLQPKIIQLKPSIVKAWRKKQGSPSLPTEHVNYSVPRELR